MNVIEAQELVFGYDKKAPSIHQLSLSVPQGAIYGFLGHNGAGKSTTIRLLLGLLQPLSGAVSLFGTPLQQCPRSQWARIGALIESPSLYEHLSATENLRITATYCGVSHARIAEVLHITDLSAHGAKPVKAFSTGMKQRLGLALALLNNPEVLVLDEPTNGLDPQGIVEIRTLIQRLNTELGKTIFLSSHQLSEIELLCSQVAIIKQGQKRFEGSIADLKAAHANGLSLHIHTDNIAGATQVLAQLGLPAHPNGQSVSTQVQHRNQAPAIASGLVAAGVNLYEMKFEENKLETLFLQLSDDSSKQHAP